MNTKMVRARENLTQKEFAEKYHIPVRTVQGWDYKDNMPSYVLALIVDVQRLEENQKSTETRLDGAMQFIGRHGLSEVYGKEER